MPHHSWDRHFNVGHAARRAAPQLGWSFLLLGVPRAVPHHKWDGRFNCWACRTPCRTTVGMVVLIPGRVARRAAPQLGWSFQLLDVPHAVPQHFGLVVLDFELAARRAGPQLG